MLIAVSDAKVCSKIPFSVCLMHSFLFQTLKVCFPFFPPFFFANVFFSPFIQISQLGSWKRGFIQGGNVFACLLASFSFVLEVTGCEAG